MAGIVDYLQDRPVPDLNSLLGSFAGLRSRSWLPLCPCCATHGDITGPFPPLPPTLPTTEAVPLLLALAREHPQLETRSAMAACLFNLIKKPSAEQVCLRGEGGVLGV